MFKYCKKFFIMLIVIATVLGTSVTGVSAAQPYIGEIMLVGFNFTPVDWLPCEGQSLQTSGYEALFNLIGTTYGGDGQEFFMLPDLRGLEPYPGTHYCISPFGVYPSQT